MKKSTDIKNKQKDKKEQGIPEILRPTMQVDGRILTDPLGSWTGVPADDIFDTPVQDVDDL